MFYLKNTDFVGIFELPATFFQPQIESRIEQRERVNIEYVLTKDLGEAFYTDLDASGNPQALRFQNIDNLVRNAILGLTFIEVFTFLKNINSPIGIASVKKEVVNRYPYEELALIYDESINNAKLLRKYIVQNSSVYPEYCSCCASEFRRFLL